MFKRLDTAIASPCGYAEADDNRLFAGRESLRLGDPGTADGLFTKVLTHFPNQPEALLLRGDARYSLGRFADAQKDYEAVLAAPSQQPVLSFKHKAHIGLAHVLCRSMQPGSLDQAKQHLAAADRAGGNAPAGPWQELAEARVAFESGKEDRAESMVSQLVEQYRNDPRVWLALAEICDVRGQYDKAMQAAEGASRMSQNDDDAGLMTRALGALRAGLNEDPGLLESYLRQLHARSGQLGFALVLQRLHTSSLTSAQQSTLSQAAAEVSNREGPRLDARATCDPSQPPLQNQPQEYSIDTPYIGTTDPAALSARAIAALRQRGKFWEKTYEACLTILEQRYGPLSFWTLITQAEKLVDTPRKVADLLAQAARINPQDRTTHMKLLRVQVQLNEVDTSLLTRIQKSRPSEALGTKVFLLELEVTKARRSGDFAAVIAALDNLCESCGEPRFFALRANIKYILGNHSASEVRADCDLALAYDNTHYLALCTRAYQDLDERNIPLAVQNAKLCRSKHPSQPEPIFILAEVATILQRWALAIDYYKEYLKEQYANLRQQGDRARVGLALAYIKNRQPDVAKQVAKEVDWNGKYAQEAKDLYAIADEDQALNNRGISRFAEITEIETLIDAKQYDRALANLHQHGHKNPQNVYSLALRARCYFEMNNFLQAELDAQLAQDIAFYDSVYDPMSERILRESRNKNATVWRTMQDFINACTNYFEP